MLPGKEKIPFDAAIKKYLKWLDATTSALRGHTYDPATEKGYAAKNTTDMKDLYRLYADGVNPLYVIATTDHQGDFSNVLQSAYDEVQTNEHPFLGSWIDNQGYVYTDISYPKNHGMTDEDAHILRQHHSQKSIMKITPDGRVSFIPRISPHA